VLICNELTLLLHILFELSSKKIHEENSESKNESDCADAQKRGGGQSAGASQIHSETSSSEIITSPLKEMTDRRNEKAETLLCTSNIDEM
jgi:hypothetical protein